MSIGLDIEKLGRAIWQTAGDVRGASEVRNVIQASSCRLYSMLL